MIFCTDSTVCDNCGFMTRYDPPLPRIDMLMLHPGSVCFCTIRMNMTIEEMQPVGWSQKRRRRKNLRVRSYYQSLHKQTKVSAPAPACSRNNTKVQLQQLQQQEYLARGNDQKKKKSTYKDKFRMSNSGSQYIPYKRNVHMMLTLMVHGRPFTCGLVGFVRTSLSK